MIRLKARLPRPASDQSDAKFVRVQVEYPPGTVALDETKELPKKPDGTFDRDVEFVTDGSFEGKEGESFTSTTGYIDNNSNPSKTPKVETHTITDDVPPEDPETGAHFFGIEETPDVPETPPEDPPADPPTE